MKDEQPADVLQQAPGPSPASRGATDFPVTLRNWASVMSKYAHNASAKRSTDDAKARAQRFETGLIERRGGAPLGLADRTDGAPIDTRVWLHMYPNQDGYLENSFCERTGDAHFMYDFNGFRDWRVEQNALLSDDAKCLMAKLYFASPDVWGSKELAHVFKIREERALAIVKIKEKEFEQADACVVALNRLQEMLSLSRSPTLDELHRPEHKHSVRHLTAWFEPWLQLYEALPQLTGGVAPTEPADELSEAADTNGDGSEGGASGAVAASVDEAAGEGGVTTADEPQGKGASGADGGAGGAPGVVNLSDADMDELVKLHNFLAAAANREAQHIALNRDVWQAVYHYGTGEPFVPDFQTMPSFEEYPLSEASNWTKSEYDHVLDTLGKEQHEAAIAEFKVKLAWNLGEIGKSIQRQNRRRRQESSTLPRKPDGGWPILVTPLVSGGKTLDPFVAMPDGHIRELTEDEMLYVHLFKKEPRMYSRPRRHAPFTNSTLHAFQRKPNKSHDLYNPPYLGTLSKKRPTTGPERRDIRMEKMRKHAEARTLKHQLRALR